MYTLKPAEHWVKDNHLWLDPLNGEAIAENILEHGDTPAQNRVAYIRTGFFFERTFQQLPDPVNMETGRQMVDIPDWAFAAPGTAQAVAALLADAMPELNYARVIEGAQLKMAPYSRKPLVIHLSSSRGGQVVVNAGLIAFVLARYCSYDPTSGRIRRNYGTALAPIIEAFRLELSSSAADNNRVVAGLAGLEGAPNKFMVMAQR